MCTAANYKSKDHYFGRTLDWEVSYGEKVTVTPRNFPFKFYKEDSIDSHLALIGMAVVAQNTPLYFEATNEKGLSMAGLNFPQNAVYLPFNKDKYNITVSEIIPWVLSKSEKVEDAKLLLEKTNILNIQLDKNYPLTPLHWIVSDRDSSITVEPTAAGLKIYENPVGVLTNNPPFSYHMYNLANYMNLTTEDPENRFSDKADLKIYCKGMGSIGLPGDPSSASRFIRAAFLALNSVSSEDESDSVSQFFHILDGVAQVRGCARASEDKYEQSLYTSCCNTDKGIYYYITCSNPRINAVKMHSEKLDGSSLLSYELKKENEIAFHN